MRLCVEDGCERAVKAVGLCGRHYQRRRPEDNAKSQARRKAAREAKLQEFLAKQGGVCPLCGITAMGHEFVLDHDHSCCLGKRPCGNCYRGALCDPCNRGLGFFGDDPDRMRAAASYLEERRA